MQVADRSQGMATMTVRQGCATTCYAPTRPIWRWGLAGR